MVTTSSRDWWTESLKAGPECLSLERIAEGGWSPVETAHVAACARCQAEERLWSEFAEPTPADVASGADLAEAADVAAIVARLTPANAPNRGRVVGHIAPRQPWTSSPWIKMAAGVVLVAGLGAALLNRPPDVAEPQAGDVYRSATVEVLGPMGDLASAPAQLSWQSVPGAVKYEVSVNEVDGTPVWSSSTTQPLMPIPTEVARLCVPGKPLGWRVTARAGDGAVLAQSAVQRFRVVRQ